MTERAKDTLLEGQEDVQTVSLGEYKLKPGSAEAFIQGCCCPVMDNRGGEGYRENPRVWIINGDCRLHGRS